MGIELLAPAGDFTCLISAVQAGADAVYIGAGKFSARQNAANFSGEELVRALDYCHIRGVKVYLAINTLILDKELKEAIAVAKEAYEAGIDAFIVQDIGLAKILKEEFDVPLHASTQMTIFNEAGLYEAERMGFKRAVLARECGKEEIKNLAKKSKMELEVFCHGALCICYSGQCLMSSMLGGRSANRGNCAQPCRLSYSYNGQSGYYLSPKDLSLLDEISDLKAMGVSSLKIEGRMKGPVYVAAAVSIFRKVIDTGNFQKEDEITLQNAFSRGGSFTKGLYQGFRGKEMMNISSSNDNLYEGYDKALYKSMEPYFKEEANLKKVKVKASFLVDSNGAKFILTDLKGRTGEAFLPLEKEEKGRAIGEELAKSQLLKLGSTPYIADTLECDIKETAYYSASELNGMRRKASDALSLARTVRREKEPVKDYNYYILKEPKTFSEDSFYISASVTTKEQYKALYDAGLSRIYAPLSFAEEVGAYAGILDAVFDENKILSASRIIAGSLGAYSYSKKAGKLTSADYSMNIFNSVSALALDFEFVTLSPELSLRQCMDISSYAKTEAIAYGYLPLMKIGNCIVNAAGECKQKRCAGCDKEIKLKDRKGAIFKIKSDGKMNILYNSVPIFMADKLNEIKSAGIGGVRLSFTFESPVECAKIYLMFKENKKIEFPKSFTRGHFYRGF